MFVLTMLAELMILGILCTGAYLGAKRGFVHIMAKPVKIMLSLIVAFRICDDVASALVVPLISKPITGSITEYLYENCEGLSAADAPQRIPTLIKIAAAVFDIEISGVVGAGDTDAVSAVVDRLTGPAVYVIALIVSFAVLYVLCRILFSLLLRLFDRALSDGPLGGVNRTAGMVFGSMIAFIGAWMLVSALDPLLDGASAPRGGVLYEFFNSFSPIELLLKF